MMFNAGTVKGTLDLGIQKFKTSVSAAIKGFKDMGNSSKRASGSVKSFGSSFKGMALKLGGAVAGFIAIRAAIRKVTETLKDGIAKQQAYEQSVRRLSAALITQGSPAVAQITKDMEAFATALQDTTAYGDVDVLGTAQALTSFGAAGDKLREYTKAVLDTAAALNLDAKTAARAFGQALAGNAATLGRYIPALRGMTKEQLEAGVAFDKAAEAFGGFSEIAAQSTTGALTQLGNAWDDVKKRIGAAFNESLRPLAQELTKMFRGLATSLDEDTDKFKNLVVVVGNGFIAMLSGVQMLASGFFTIRESVSAFGLEIAYVEQVFVDVIASLAGGFKDIDAFIARVAGGIARLIESIPGLPAGIKESMHNVMEYFQKAEEESRASSARMDDMRLAARRTVEERKKELAAIMSQRGALEANLQTTIGILKTAVQGNTQKTEESTLERRIREEKEQQMATAIRLQKLAAERKQNLMTRLEKYRELRAQEAAAREAAEGTRNATEGIAGAAGAAASNVNAMADSFGRVAESANSAAQAAASIGGDAGTRAGESRRAGGSTSLDFSDPFRAISLAQQAQEQLRATHPSAWAGRTQVNAAAQYARGVGAAAQATVERALSDFTASIISELNSAGVMNPADRSRIIRERISEAERLGVIPSAARLERINSGVLR